MSDCQTCVQAGSCTSCKQGLFLYPTNGTCSSCTALNEAKVTTTCLSCDPSCLTCSASAPTDCLTCDPLHYLAPDSRCLRRLFLVLSDALFSNEQTEAVFTFDRDIAVPLASSLRDNCEVALFTNPVADVRSAVSQSQSSQVSLQNTPSLSAVTAFSVSDFVVQGGRLRVKTKVTTTTKDATLVVRFKSVPGLHQAGNKHNTYPERVLVADKVNVVVTQFDGALNSAASGVKSTVTTATSAMFLISLPQAFILMKVFQTVDFYIFIDCEYPPNFSKFLELISKNVMDFVPNVFEDLADDDGTELYPRFTDFGQQVHIFKNLGSLFTLCLCVLGLKLIFFSAHKVFPKVKLLRSKPSLTQNSTPPSEQRSSSASSKPSTSTSSSRSSSTSASATTSTTRRPP